MSRTLPRRILAQSPFSASSNSNPVFTLPLRCLRPFSITTRQQAGDYLDRDFLSKNRKRTPKAPPTSGATSEDTSEGTSGATSPREAPSAPNTMGDLASSLAQAHDVGALFSLNQKNRKDWRAALPSILDGTTEDGLQLINYNNEAPKEPHHFHIFATRHNTHITVTDPKRNPLISLSCGNIGFRHSGRKHYDSAFQLASLVLARMQERGINNNIMEVEVILRGFGAGREAVTKAILGSEGRLMRDKVIRVTDATRLKFGGSRSSKPRRLG